MEAVRGPSVISLTSNSSTSSVPATQPRHVFTMPDTGIVVIPDSDKSDQYANARITGQKSELLPPSSPKVEVHAHTSTRGAPTVSKRHQSPSIIVISSEADETTQVVPNTDQGSPDQPALSSSASHKENLNSVGVDVSLAGPAQPGAQRLVSFAELASSGDPDALTDLDAFFGEDIFMEHIQDDRHISELEDRYSDVDDERQSRLNAVPDNLAPFGDPMRFEMWPSLMENPNPATQWVMTLLFKWRVSILASL